METLFSDPSKVGAYAILLGVLAAFMAGKIIPISTHDRVVKERDRYLEMLTRANELLGRASVSGVEIAKVASVASTQIDIARIATDAATAAIARYKDQHGQA